MATDDEPGLLAIGCYPSIRAWAPLYVDHALPGNPGARKSWHCIIVSLLRSKEGTGKMPLLRAQHMGGPLMWFGWNSLDMGSA